ncbi:MAG: hypothetical protein QOG38_1780 [Hyphomicrobiales bacterium]|jgi:hypothetical protein|nr:hypothetical protein [Hyphomicrobiales bacterium]
MTVRPPRPLASRIWTANPAAALDYEIAQEKASNLGRLGRGLEQALNHLAAFDADGPASSDQRRAERRQLVAQAGHSLWLLVVQREALGLRATGQLMRDYRVPAEVQNRMGLLMPVGKQR